MAVPTRGDLDTLVRQRLAEDPSFRERLLTEPRLALSALTGVEIPEFVSVTVHEESLTDVHLVIPVVSSDELDDDDLELVAGGDICWVDYCQGEGGFK